MTLLRLYWKRIPMGIRGKFHLLLHRFNSNRFLLSLFHFRHIRTKRRLTRFEEPVKLRIGESRRFVDWHSTNFQLLAPHFLNATRNYGKNVCRFIFADNVIEHLDYDSGRLLLEKAFSALIHDGILRLTTPDLRQIVSRYLLASPEDLMDFAHDLREHEQSVISFPDFLRVTFTSFGHDKGFIYDFETLRAVLKNVGFVEVKKFLPGESDEPHLRNLETRVGKSDIWSQMAVEARKP